MNEQFYKRVGMTIRQKRKEQLMTMKELGEKVGLSESTVQRYESGQIKKMDTQMLHSFAQALGIKTSYLAGWDNSKQNTGTKTGEGDAMLIKKYSQLSSSNKKAVRTLIDNLLSGQSK